MDFIIVLATTLIYIPSFFYILAFPLSWLTYVKFKWNFWAAYLLNIVTLPMVAIWVNKLLTLIPLNTSIYPGLQLGFASGLILLVYVVFPLTVASIVIMPIFTLLSFRKFKRRNKK